MTMQCAWVGKVGLWFNLVGLVHGTAVAYVPRGTIPG